MSDKFRKEFSEMHKKQITSEIGAKAKVRRELVKGDHVTNANRTLNSIGEKINPAPKALEYLGSAAVHIYKASALDELFVLSQTNPLLDTPEILAAKAFDDLKNRVMEHYGRKAPKLRSGF